MMVVEFSVISMYYTTQSMTTFPDKMKLRISYITIHAMNSAKKCRCVRTSSKKRTPWATIGSLWVMLITRKVKVLA